MRPEGIVGIGVYWSSQSERESKLCCQTDLYRCLIAQGVSVFDWQLLDFSSLCVKTETGNKTERRLEN